jgi:hypothetical protein
LLGINKIDLGVSDDELFFVQMFASFKLLLLPYAMYYCIRKNKWFLKNYILKQIVPLFKLTGKTKYENIVTNNLKYLNELNEEDMKNYQTFWLFKCKNGNYVANDELTEFINHLLSMKVQKPTFKNIFNISKSLTFLIFLDDFFKNFFDIEKKKKYVSFKYKIKKKEYTDQLKKLPDRKNLSPPVLLSLRDIINFKM